jgi:protein SCO1/2
MKKSKILILLITLSFPVILYLFLRSFGQNEFDLPVFFENEEKIFCDDSNMSIGNIELIDLNQANFIKMSELYEADYKVIHFPNIQDSEIQSLKNELSRILNTFGDLSFNILSFKPIDTGKVDQLENELFLSASRTKTFLYPEDNMDDLINCVYGFPTAEWDGMHPSEEIIATDKTLVLLDDKNRIRGYYNGYETKEVDRLILEIRVLLSKK